MLHTEVGTTWDYPPVKYETLMSSLAEELGKGDTVVRILA